MTLPDSSVTMCFNFQVFDADIDVLLLLGNTKSNNKIQKQRFDLVFVFA